MKETLPSPRAQLTRRSLFKVLADMPEMKASPQEVESLHMAIREKVSTSEVRKMAIVVSKSAVAAIAGKRVGEGTGLVDVGLSFSGAAEAQARLDE